MQTMVPLYGFGGVPYSAVRKAAPRNLLDNSDFRNPVNQRGVSSASNNNYGIDRWPGAYTVSGKYINNTGGMTQYIPEEKIVSGREYTASICLEDGTVYSKSGTIVHGVTGWQINAWFSDLFVGVQYISNKNAYVFRLNVRTGTVYNIAWAALYEGKFTADTLPEYKPKGYGAELAECQRYYQIRSANNIAAVDMRPTMRLSSPTITSVTGGYAYSADL